MQIPVKRLPRDGFTIAHRLNSSLHDSDVVAVRQNYHEESPMKNVKIADYLYSSESRANKLLNHPNLYRNYDFLDTVTTT